MTKEIEKEIKPKKKLKFDVGFKTRAITIGKSAGEEQERQRKRAEELSKILKGEVDDVINACCDDKLIAKVGRDIPAIQEISKSVMGGTSLNMQITVLTAKPKSGNPRIEGSLAREMGEGIFILPTRIEGEMYHSQIIVPLTKEEGFVDMVESLAHQSKLISENMPYLFNVNLYKMEIPGENPFVTAVHGIEGGLWARWNVTVKNNPDIFIEPPLIETTYNDTQPIIGVEDGILGMLISGSEEDQESINHAIEKIIEKSQESCKFDIKKKHIINITPEWVATYGWAKGVIKKSRTEDMLIKDIKNMITDCEEISPDYVMSCMIEKKHPATYEVLGGFRMSEEFIDKYTIKGECKRCSIKP